MIFRHTNLPPDEFSARRNGDYIWRDLWTGPSVCNRPVAGSHGFGSSNRLEQCCLWLAALPFRRMGNAEVLLSHHLLPTVSRTRAGDRRITYYGQGRLFSQTDQIGEIEHFCARQTVKMSGNYVWAVRPHVIFVKMKYTLGNRRTFQGDLALCGLHEFLRLNVADIHKGISEKVVGTVSTSAFLLDMTVMSSSGVIVSPSDVPVGL